MNHDEGGPLPRKPPNAWNNKVVFINNPESFPELKGKEKSKASQSRPQTRPSQEKVQVKNSDFEDKLREIKERLNKKVEEKMAQLEKKYSELEDKLTKALESMERMTQSFEKYEERITDKQNKTLEIVEKQIDDANARQNAFLTAQIEQMYAALCKTMPDKFESLRCELTEPKKKSKGVVKPQANKNDSP